MSKLEQRIRSKNYKSHKTRTSDSSLYDEICTICGARDYTIGPDELSNNPCPGRSTVTKIPLENYVSKDRQMELIRLAPMYPASAVRMAIEDGVMAALSGKVVEAENAKEEKT